MKSTGHLTAMGDFTLQKDLIILHPNDGYDLGLITKDNAVRIFSGASREDFLAGKGKFIPGIVQLLNECTHTTVRMNLSWWQEIGKPRRVRLTYHQEKLLISKT
jgi:hypothetical protein